MSGYSHEDIEAWKEEDEQMDDLCASEQVAITKAKAEGWTNIRWSTHQRKWLGTDMFGNPNTVLKI